VNLLAEGEGYTPGGGVLTQLDAKLLRGGSAVLRSRAYHLRLLVTFCINLLTFCTQGAPLLVRSG